MNTFSWLKARHSVALFFICKACKGKMFGDLEKV